MTAPDNSPGATSTELLITLTRLEGKLDAALAQHGAELAAHGADIADHEARLRVLEAKPTVAPRTLWTVTASALTLIIAAVSTVAVFF